MNSSPSKMALCMFYATFCDDSAQFIDICMIIKMAATAILDRQIGVVSSDKKFPFGLWNNYAKGEHCNTK